MIDFHFHSLYSDGTDAPEALALMADEAGLHAACLTDHDTLDGIPRFLAMQPHVKVKLLAGTELSCKFLGRSLHMLGLLVDPADATFQTRLKELRERRDDRNGRMVARLKEVGCPLELEDVQAHADSPLISRMHFALALKAKGYVNRAQDAFDRLIGDNGPAFVEREELEPAEAARWIREAGGIPIVAHPGRFYRGEFDWREPMAELQRQGVEGFEAYYGEYQPAQQHHFLRLSEKLRMAVSGGSDYHGANKPGLKLGVGRGSLRVPDAVLEDLEYRKQRGA
ncbi:MAG: PHP domain-containing protein [Acidobacteria bacterium]|nr:PHP domain-containing protein [Acidobacteriota bacterium]